MSGFGPKYQSWAAKQRGNPLLLGVAAGCFTISLLISYKWYYTPWQRKNKRIAAEEYAQKLYEQELK